MNRYQDEDWQQEEQRRREAYYRMNSQNSNTPDALEQIFREIGRASCRERV